MTAPWRGGAAEGLMHHWDKGSQAGVSRSSRHVRSCPVRATGRALPSLLACRVSCVAASSGRGQPHSVRQRHADLAAFPWPMLFSLLPRSQELCGLQTQMPGPARAGPLLIGPAFPLFSICGRCSGIVTQVGRATRVLIAELSGPGMRSSLRRPGIALSSTSAGRSPIIGAAPANDLPLFRAGSRARRDTRPECRQTESPRFRSPRPCAPRARTSNPECRTPEKSPRGWCSGPVLWAGSPGKAAFCRCAI